MGMFDSVIVRCLNCGEYELEFQSKVGECELHDYRVDNCPSNIAADIIGDTTCCKKCGRPATMRGTIMLFVD